MDFDKQNNTDPSDLRRDEVEVACDRFSNEVWVSALAHAPLERELTVYVNLRELVTILCTPRKLKYLVLGFLYAEGIISSLDDILMMRVCDEEAEVDVRLKNGAFELPTKRRLTSGCGGGSTFSMEGQAVRSEFVVKPADILSLMKQLQEQMDLYQISGGVHTSALADIEKLLVVTEDIGRHNTLDKIQGESLATGISTEDRIILTTGRVSSEMLLKAARMKTPIVASRHTPTATAIVLAGDLGIALVGRAGGNHLTVYSHRERLGLPARTEEAGQSDQEGAITEGYQKLADGGNS